MLKEENISTIFVITNSKKKRYHFVIHNVDVLCNDVCDY